MATFPSLSTEPVVSFGDQISYDPTIRDKYEGGYVFTRSRFTRTVRKFSVLYDGLNLNDVISLKNFEESVKVGSDAFDWTNPDTGENLVVRLSGPIKYNKNQDFTYKASFEVEEV